MERERITVPSPDEIRRRIAQRRDEILALKQLLKLSTTAQRAAELSVNEPTEKAVPRGR